MDNGNQRAILVKAAFILGGISIAEGVWVFINLLAAPQRLLHAMGFLDMPAAGIAAWAAAALVALVYVSAGAKRLPSVRANLVRPSWLKLLALSVAIIAGLFEEFFFRRMVMDALAADGVALQLAATALTFGLAHGIWGLFKRSWRAALGATVATGLLGFLLGIIYLLGDRNLAPCIVSHFAINLFAEPGLVLAALRGEMSNRSAPQQAL